MQLKQLEYFITTAESLNISHAAKRLYMTQQALSEQISKLEQEYGAVFFLRGKKITLTREGECMLETAKKILAQERGLRNQLNTLNNQVVGTINVGMSYVRARFLFPSLFAAFKERFPFVTINLYTGSSEEIKADIRSGVTDIVIGFDQFFFDEISTFPLYKERLFVTIPRNFLIQRFPNSWQDELPRLNRGIDMSEFADFPIISINRSNYIWKLTQQILDSKRIEANIIFEGNDMELLCYISKTGIGLSFVSELVASSVHLFRDEGEDTLHVFPVAGPIYMPLVIGYNNRQYFSQLSHAFVEIVKDEYGKKMAAFKFPTTES